MNKNVEQAITAVRDAKLKLNVEIGKAYPPGTEVIAKLGGHLLHLKVRQTNPVYWDGSGDIYAENVKTGKRRTLRDSDVQEVIYKPELHGPGGSSHDQ